MAPSMLMGMVIGVLGVVWVKQKVLAYTEPGARGADGRAHRQTAQANAAAGFAVPQSFSRAG